MNANNMKNHARKRIVVRVIIYAGLSFYAITVLLPILLMFVTSLKSTREIFQNPFGPPAALYLENYAKVFGLSNYLVYFVNSIVVTVLSLFFIITMSAMGSHVLAKYRFRGRNLLYYFFAAGLVVPVRLGTISLMRTVIGVGLYDNIIALILINTAVGIPFGVFIFTDFIRAVPEELSNSARVDGCSEPGIFLRIIVPLLRPAIAAVALVNLIPIWNDFWFPLIFIKSDGMKTVPLATALLFGQFQTNFGLVFAVLSMASLPVILLYLLLSKQFIKGLSSGALKG